MRMLELFKVGDIIFGYCSGYFGRDGYDNKVCVMVTPRYAVFENMTGELFEKGDAVTLNYTELCTSDKSHEEIIKMVAKWKIEEEG